MLLTLGLMFVVGLALGAVCARLKLPRLVGMMATGLLLGPHVLNLVMPARWRYRPTCASWR